MEELFNLKGHYNLEINIDEDERQIYVSSNTATSFLLEDINTLQQITGAEKTEIYPDIEKDQKIIIHFTLPEKQ